MGATLQLLTGGRFILGIGAGWLEAEHLAYGYAFPEALVRIRQLEEAVQIIRKMWTETPATFEGKHYRIKDALCEPRPDPLPPIMIGGGGEHLILRVVARHADWWNIPGAKVETYAHKLAALRSHCQAVGREYNQIVKTWAGWIATPYYQDGQGLLQLVGTSDQIAGQLRAFTKLGVEHFMLGFADFPDPAGALMFAREVIPEFR